MNPNYERVAEKAAETITKFGISSDPVDLIPIIGRIPGVVLVSYEKMSNEAGMDREKMIEMFGNDKPDAFTSVNLIDGKVQYLITYNKRLPNEDIQKVLARELGHIVLGHDGSRPQEVRDEEARCFAEHLLGMVL